jgi:hypothetical protein
MEDKYKALIVLVLVLGGVYAADKAGWLSSIFPPPPEETVFSSFSTQR